MLIDYHLHNQFSPDSETPSNELIKSELSHGIKHICITNHAEWFDKKEETTGIFETKEAENRFTKIQKDLEKTRKKFPTVDIRFGAEIQYQEPYLNPLKKWVEKTPFDFVLGSVHCIDGILISGGKNADKIFKTMSEEKAYTKYFEELYKLVEWGPISAVAHFDICKKFGHLTYGPFKPQKYKNQILKILEVMKKRKIGMELNAGSLHKNCHELFPHPDILKWCLEIGIEYFTLGSDAHKAEFAGIYISEVLAIAKKVGISHLNTYKNRLPTKHRI